MVRKILKYVIAVPIMMLAALIVYPFIWVMCGDSIKDFIINIFDMTREE